MTTKMTAPVQLTNDQFQQLLQAAMARPVAPPDGAGMVAGAAAIVGEMPPCNLGKDRLRRYKKWKDWLREAENKMTFLQIQDEKAKLNFIRSCAGAELTTFWEKEARIRFADIARDEARGIAAAVAHTYGEVLEESKKALLKLISRDRAIIDLLRMEQGTRSFMDFLCEVEDQEYICRVEEQPITGDDLKRMSLIAGMKDRTLAEKAMAEEYSLTDLIKTAITRETSKANVEAMRARPTTNVNRVTEGSTDIYSQVEALRAELEVMRVKQVGKYSRKYKPPDTIGQRDRRCEKCNYQHDQSRRCPADGKRCNVCAMEGHFARSPLCKAQTKPQYTTKWVEDETPTPSDSDDDSATVARIERSWPGVRKGTNTVENLKFVLSKAKKDETTDSKHVKVEVGGTPIDLYCDTGSRYTIIPPDMYSRKMGKLVPADCHLRAWGATAYLDTKGMVHTTLRTPRGAHTQTKVYIVAGTRPEPLLGAKDAEDLGIIQFNPQGRPPTDRTPEVRHIKCIAEKLRQSGVPVKATKAKDQRAETPDRREALTIISRYSGTVLTERIGCMKIPPVKLQYEEGFRPVQPPPYPIPYHYRDRLAEHIKRLKKEGIIEDVEPAEAIDCVLNTTITEKKTAGAIRMNVDARPINVGAKHQISRRDTSRDSTRAQRFKGLY